MPDQKKRSHKVTITVRVDRPITRSQAVHAAWNALDGFDLYGNEDRLEPWGRGKLTVPRRPNPRTY